MISIKKSCSNDYKNDKLAAFSSFYAQNNIASIAKCIYECFHHDSLIFVLHRESVNDYFANRA